MRTAVSDHSHQMSALGRDHQVNKFEQVVSAGHQMFPSVAVSLYSIIGNYSTSSEQTDTIEKKTLPSRNLIAGWVNIIIIVNNSYHEVNKSY